MKFYLFVLVSFFSCAASAQKDTAYISAITQRSDKIVAGLNISDAKKALRVRDLVKRHYFDLNAIYAVRDTAIQKAKRSGGDKAMTDTATKKAQEKSDKSIKALHPVFLAKLSKELTPEQVEGVKDGLTYNVVHVTYKGYVNMIPSLTEPQKKQIMDWLTEAREYAMDAESSDKKHAWFGKYKGRINNYLSAAGYDITKERKAWEARIKAEEETRKNPAN